MAETDRALVNNVKNVFPTLEHLFQAGDDVSAVIDHPGFEAVCALLDKEAQDCLALAERPTALAKAEYARLHGTVRGLRAARRAAIAIRGAARKAHEEAQAQNEAADAAAAER